MTAPAKPRVLFQSFPGFQTKALQASADEVLMGGAKGSGKSLILVAKPLYQTHKPNYKALILRETYGELQEVLDRMHRMYLHLPADVRPVWHGDNERRRWEFPSGAKIKLGYYRRKEDISHYQGQEWSDILFDEIGNLQDETALETLLAEMRSPDPDITRQFCCTANPGGKGHGWLRRRFINLCGKNGEKIVYVKRRLPNGSVETVTRQFVPGRVTDNPIYANDPKYMARLMSLPERLRRCLLDGDWDAATGAAFDELDPDVHLVKPFECPSHWPYVAAFDWGYSHWAVFGWGRVSEDGRVYVCDTLRWRHFQDWDLVEAIKEMVPHQALRSVQAGHDLWHELRANRGDGTPTRAEYFQANGIGVTQAYIARAAGYANMMQYVAHRETPYIEKRQPALRFFDTPGNRWLVEEHLPSIVVNPDNPSDTLKVDADSETGEGGDDGYDMVRMLLARRPFKAPSKLPIVLSASSEYVLRREAEKVLNPHLTEVDPSRPRPRLPGQLPAPYLGA